MIEKTTYTNENTPTYAERVTSQYDRISMLLGKDKAHFFNEFIRGASLLDENEHGFLSKVETVSDDELYIFIDITTSTIVIKKKKTAAPTKMAIIHSLKKN